MIEQTQCKKKLAPFINVTPITSVKEDSENVKEMRDDKVYVKSKSFLHHKDLPECMSFDDSSPKKSSIIWGELGKFVLEKKETTEGLQHLIVIKK